MKELPEGLDINQLWATGNLDQINYCLLNYWSSSGISSSPYPNSFMI
ncbi:MAG: hypothetical protein LBS20_11725 [Prevotella sp.]|jgi:hypothetical protein|nr:hypothetical protein [Prevotella sp.]